MPNYTRPTYPQLKTRIAADLAALPAVLREPLATAWGQACHGVHGYLDWIDRQCSPLTCELERLGDWAALYRVPRLIASAASGAALAGGTPGTIILASAILRGQNGQDYTVPAAVTLGAPPHSKNGDSFALQAHSAALTPVPIRCIETGEAGNLAAGQFLTLIDPVAGCESQLTVAAGGLTGGAPDEAVDNWRLRVADEWQVVSSRGARSGKDDDYRYWAKSAHPSVTSALIERHVLGIGTVLVRPICNALPDRLPTQAVLDAVAACLLDIAPATADWRVAPPVPQAVIVRLHLAPSVDAEAARAAIRAALLTAVLARSRENASLEMAAIDAAVLTVTTQFTRLAPLDNLIAGNGEVFVFNRVEFV